MNLEDLVLTLEQARHLQELDLDTSDAVLCWYHSEWKGAKWQVTSILEDTRKELKIRTYENLISAYTLPEILAKLPERILIEGKRYYKHIDDVDCRVWYESIYVSDRCAEEDGETLLDASYKMLCWLIENGYVKTK